jgi:glycerate 2-kinase
MSFKYVKNHQQILSGSLDEESIGLRKLGLFALERAIESVRPSKLIKNALHIKDGALHIDKDKFGLREIKSIYLIGGGKASVEMALTLVEILEEAKIYNYKGLINIPDWETKKIIGINSKIIFNPASHPLPNKSGLEGTRKMVSLIENATKDDLIICLISGGGSALLPLPKRGISLKDLQEVNALLLACGASIQEINSVRKHLSDFKGGNLARKIYHSSGAPLISLIISDVVGNNLDSIASGPTVPDHTTFLDAKNILTRYGIFGRVPLSVQEVIDNGIMVPSLENPKDKDPCFDKVRNYLIGSVDVAVDDVITFLNSQDFICSYYSKNVIGEAKEYANDLVKLILGNIKKLNKEKRRIALIGTGELTVTIQGKGVGGRNQEMLLSFLKAIQTKRIEKKFLILAANLDGIEGNSHAMGALIDSFLNDEIQKQKIDIDTFLKNNDSNSVFKQMGTELISGATGCNVNDIIIALLRL